MKHVHRTIHSPHQVLAALILTGILSLGTSMTFMGTAAANSLRIPQGVTNLKQNREVPRSVIGDARNVRRNLPGSVTNAVLQDASRRSNLSIAQLRIVKAEKRDWPNGCLGIVEAGVLCTQAIVPGWQVTVRGGRQTFVYRTNQSGSVVKLENGATQGNGGAVQIPRSELPPPLGEGVVFRAISSGGITGRTYETRLLADGTVIQEITQPKGLATPAQSHKISRQQLRQFERFLDQEQFSQFNRLSYPAPNGAADYITVTLTSRDSTTRYVDIAQNQLPEPLREVIKAWNQIANSK